MNFTQKNIDDLTLQLNIEIGREDYADKKKKILEGIRKKADIRGFRKGMVPFSIIEKMHGQSAIGEAVNTLISDGLNNYIKDNTLNIIGEPLPNEEDQKPIDWDNDETFEFVFDLALAPVINLTLDNKDKITLYNVPVSDKAKKEYRSNLLKQFGSLEISDKIKEEDFIIVDLEQEGLKVEATYISLKTIEDKATKKLFLGKKADHSFEINVNEAFVNETDRAAMLKIKKEELATLNPIFNLTIKEVKTFAEAQATEDTFDKVFGKGEVKTEEEFMTRIEERIATEYIQEIDYKFMLDVKDYLIEKAAIKLPENFLKRWLLAMNEGKFTMEEIEKDFELFLKDFRWQLIRQYLMKEHNIAVSKEDMLDNAKKMAAYQFAMYGLANAPEAQIAQYAESILANEKEGRKIYEKVEDDKTLDYVRSVVSTKKQKIEIEELHKLIN